MVGGYRSALAAALGAVALTLHGCGDKGGDAPTPAPPAVELGGFYHAPNFKEGSLAWLCAISDMQGSKPLGSLVLIATDDGQKFSNVNGTWSNRANGAFEANLSSKDCHPACENRAATLNGTSIYFENTTDEPAFTWTRMNKPMFKLEDAKPNSTYWVVEWLRGLYKDPNHYTDGTWDGLRMISTDGFPHIAIIGKDNTSDEFWTIPMMWDPDHPGKDRFIADFSPKGGPKNFTGYYNATLPGIVWADKNVWMKQEVTTASELSVFL
jgi:hypothetical protein